MQSAGGHADVKSGAQCTWLAVNDVRASIYYCCRADRFLDYLLSKTELNTNSSNVQPYGLAMRASMPCLDSV